MTAAVRGRAAVVLSRFPYHFGAGDPGKRFGEIVTGLADELDVLSTQVGGVRRAHRIAEAPTRLDLLRLAALHDIGDAALDLVAVRVAALADADAADTESLATLTGIPSTDLDAADPDALVAAIAEAIAFTTRLGHEVGVVRRTIHAHRIGNGTSTALLTAACGYLGLTAHEIVHSDDRWWHLATCTDDLAPELDGTAPQPDVVALQENPFADASVAPVARRHGDRFRVARGGLEDVTVTTQVRGIGDRTVAPMVVNLDAGRGVVFDGAVPDGDELAFEHYGRVTLAGVDVTGSAIAFEGGVFASSKEAHPQDFVFANATDADATGERTATFVTTAPVPDGFGPSPPLPHGGGVVRGLPMAIGESRWAMFVRVAHVGSGGRAAVPRFGAGIFDESVFGDVSGPLDPSAEVGFRWEEREPFAATVYLPQRFASVDDDTGTTLRQPLRSLLDDHRAAGVHVRVTYADPRWELGDGIARDADSDEALGIAVSGTTLWPDDTPQPSPT